MKSDPAAATAAADIVKGRTTKKNAPLKAALKERLAPDRLYGDDEDVEGGGVLQITHGGATNSDTGAYEGHGRERDDRAMLGMGRKKRAPAGANDGRRKRAAVVKKVMAERGISMIDASKAVKAEGLY
jgi:hypothetical protein